VAAAVCATFCATLNRDTGLSGVSRVTAIDGKATIS
jgi:hypothetical protein